MARIRSIKPEFWSSEQVMECSPTARLLFIGLWNFCDDAGNHVASAKTIKAEIFPGDDIPSSDVRRLLDELSSNSLIAFYSNGDKDYLHVTGWKKHQKIDKPTFKHPPFSDDARRGLDYSSPPEGSGVEGIGEEGKGEEKPSAPPAAPTPPPELIPDEPPVIGFLLNDGSEFGITKTQVNDFRKLFPAIDVMQELRNLTAWSLGNKSQRKTRSGAMRFVTGWLSRAQNRGGQRPVGTGAQSAQPDILPRLTA